MEENRLKYPQGIPVLAMGCRCDKYPFEHEHSTREQEEAKRRFQRDLRRLQKDRDAGKVTCICQYGTTICDRCLIREAMNETD